MAEEEVIGGSGGQGGMEEVPSMIHEEEEDSANDGIPDGFQDGQDGQEDSQHVTANEEVTVEGTPKHFPFKAVLRANIVLKKAFS